MGLVTLLLFPIPAYLALYYIDDWSFMDFIQLNTFTFNYILFGGAVGFMYAFIANQLMKTKLFDSAPLKVDDLVRSLNLTVFDAIFISICAGVGEELLFRVGFQNYFGVILTSIFFVAVHGYLNPKSWKHSLYGVVVLPLSFILGYGYEWFGLGFAIAVHTSYDLTLFLVFAKNNEILEE